MNYFGRIHLGLLSFTSLLITVSSLATPNPLCSDNQLSNFSFKNVAEFDQKDYCEIDNDKVPFLVKSFIQSLGEQHRKVAAQFGLSAEEAFQNNHLDFRLRGSDLGFLSSMVYLNDKPPMRLSYGVFTDWNGEKLSRGLYSHELGHVLSSSQNSVLPKAYLELSSTVLVMETMADTLALLTEGTILGDSESPATCMSNLRKIDSFQSYDFTEDFFTYDWGNRKMFSCCRQILKLNPIDRHWGQTCKDIISKAEASPVLQPVERQNIFDPNHYDPNSPKFDPHQIGIPLNSFLKDLGEQTGKNAYRLFIQAFQSASVQGLDYEELHCKIPKLEVIMPNITANQVSIGTVLNRLRNLLTADDSIIYDKLWKKHGIRKAVTIGHFDVKALVQEKQVEIFMTVFQAASKDPLLKKFIDASGCTAGDIGQINLWTNAWHSTRTPAAGCGIVCED